MLQASHSHSIAKQTHVMPKDDQKQSLLFKLPPELRNRICSYVTGQSEAEKKPPESRPPLDNSNQRTWHYDPSGNYKDHNSLPVVSLNQISDVRPSNALLGTCQCIYDEARAMFVAAQHTFWNTHSFLFDFHDDSTDDGVSTAQEIVSRLHARQIDAMPKFTVMIKLKGCLHTFHFIEDDIEMTEDQVDEGYQPNCGFISGGSSHTGDLSRWELRMRRGNLSSNLWSSVLEKDGPCVQAYYMKRYAKRARNRIAAYEKSAEAYLSIASRGRELSKIEDHAMLRWKAERVRFTRELESQQVSMKRLMLNAVIEHLCGVF